MPSPAPTAVLLNDTTVDRHHGCTLVVASIERLAAAHGIAIAARAPAHRDWRADQKLRAAVAAADIVIVNGEGTIHHDRPAAEPLLAAAAATDRPAVLINATFAGNGPRTAEMARHFAIVSVREAASAAELARAGIPCRIVPDLALLAEARPRPSGGGGGPILCTDSVLGPATVALARAGRRVGAEPLAILYGRRSPREVRRAFARTRQGPGGTATGLFERGRIALDLMAGECAGPTGFLERLGGAGLVLTGRFHVMVLCMALRVPFLVVASNTHKNRSTLADAGLAPWRHVEPEAIDAALCARAAAWGEGELAALDTFVERARNDAKTLFRDVAALALSRAAA